MMGLVQLDFENLQAWRLWSLSGQPAPMLNYTWSEEFSLCISFSHNLSIYNQCLFSLLCTSAKSLAPFSNYLSFRHWEAAVQPPEAASSPGWTSWTSSASPHRTSASTPDHSGGPLLKLLQSVNVFLASQDQKLDVVFQMQSNDYQVKGNNHFSKSAGCAPVNIVLYVFSLQHSFRG